MSTDVRGYVQSRFSKVTEAGGDQVNVPCCFCDEPEGKRGRLYIDVNPDAVPPGLLFCHLCGKKGALRTLLKHFGDPIPRETDSEAEHYTKHEILQVAAAYYHNLLGDNEEVLKWLKYERGLTLETLIKHQIGWADGTLKNYLSSKGYKPDVMQATGLVDKSGRDFLQAHVTIPYHANGNVTLIRGKDIKGKYLTPHGQKARLFNSDATFSGAKTIVVTEGEFDALVVEQLGFVAVGCPGATSWQETWNTYFDDAKKVFVVFDNDAPGIAGAEKVARGIGPKARIVKMPEAAPGRPKNDPSEWIVNQNHTKDDFQLLLVKSRGGYLLSVDDCYSEWKEVQSTPGLKLGFEVIDAKLSPGLQPAQVMILLARTGEGKTTWLLNVFQRMCMEESQKDVRILFVSLEQTRGDWYERARRIYRFYNVDAKDEDCLEFFRHRLMLVDKNRVTEMELVDCIEQYEYELGQKPDVVVVDYLGYWARGYKGEGYERTSAAIMALKAIAKEHRVAVIAPHQVNRTARGGEEFDLDAARDAGTVGETADFVLTLWSPDAMLGKKEEEKTGVIKMKIAKSRHGGKGAEMSLQFAPLTLAMVSVNDALATRARDEQDFALGKDDFEIAMYRHRTGDRSIGPHIGRN